MHLTCSNRTEALLARLNARLAARREAIARGEADPFAPVRLVVPNRNVERYAELGVARSLGIAVNLRFERLDALVRRSLDAPLLLGDALLARVLRALLDVGVAREAWAEELVGPELAPEGIARIVGYAGSARGDVATLEADISRLRTEAQQAATLEEDLTGQIAQTEAAFLRQVSADQLEVRSQLEQATERLSAAQDVLNRSVVLAPQGGEVLNLRFATRGGVVRPGEAILEIVPASGEMTASVRIQPADRAAVYEGQAVRTRVTAYKSWMTPRLDGEVISVSADLKTDQNTGASYYEVRIRIPADQAARLGELDVIPGMPVEVFIFSGSSRTTLDYLLEPISESLFRGARTG